jgi:regulator of sirC expression with transglutaminase-like and TPR domain
MGIPISLSCVYLLIGWRLNLLTHGVGLPGHFIVGHRISRGVVHIDPFNQGRILRKKDCEVMVRNAGYQFSEDLLDPVTNDQILARMIGNLLNHYTEQGNAARAHWLAQLFQSLQGGA